MKMSVAAPLLTRKKKNLFRFIRRDQMFPERAQPNTTQYNPNRIVLNGSFIFFSFQGKVLRLKKKKSHTYTVFNINHLSIKKLYIRKIV